MARFDLTDFEWSVIEPLLPNKARDKPHVDDRRVYTGAPWADIPACYGPYTTCMNRFNRWRKAGHWGRIVRDVSEAYDGAIQMVDPSSVRIHQHGANGSKKGAILLDGPFTRRLTTKIHAFVDTHGRPIQLKLTVVGLITDVQPLICLRHFVKARCCWLIVLMIAMHFIAK